MIAGFSALSNGKAWFLVSPKKFTSTDLSQVVRAGIDEMTGANAGVIDQHAEAAQRCSRRFNHGLAILSRGHVGMHNGQRVTEPGCLIGQLLQQGLRPRRCQDSRPLGSCSQR